MTQQRATFQSHADSGFSTKPRSHPSGIPAEGDRRDQPRNLTIPIRGGDRADESHHRIANRLGATREF